MSKVWGESLFSSGWRGVQARALVRHLAHARKSALYREVEVPGEITGENLSEVMGRLPLTTKDQLAAAGSGAYGVGREQVAEWVCTSGTLGKPLDVPVTEGDLERFGENEAAALSMAGVRAGDTVVLAVGMDRLFVAGLAYWLGVRKIGAACVRAGPRVGDQAGMLKELAVRTGGGRMFVVAVPSYLIMAEPVELAGIVAIGEPVRAEPGLGYNVLGARLKRGLGVR